MGLTWLNAWRQYENDSRIDGDFSPFTAVSGASEVDLDQYSSEFRITSAEDGPVWKDMGGDTLGGIYAVLKPASAVALRAG